MPLTRICDFMRLFAQLDIARKEPGYDQALEAKYCGFLNVIWEVMTSEEQDAVKSVLRSDPAIPKWKDWKAEHLFAPMKSDDLECKHFQKVHQGVEQVICSEYEHLLDRLPGDAS